MKKTLAPLTAAAVLAATPASAEWMHRVDDDPFNGDQHIVFGTDYTGFNAAVRCTSQADLTLMLIMPDKPYASVMTVANAMQPKLAVIIDDQPKVEIPAEVSQTPDGTKCAWKAPRRKLRVSPLPLGLQIAGSLSPQSSTTR